MEIEFYKFVDDYPLDDNFKTRNLKDNSNKRKYWNLSPSIWVILDAIAESFNMSIEELIDLIIQEHPINTHTHYSNKHLLLRDFAAHWAFIKLNTEQKNEPKK